VTAEAVEQAAIPQAAAEPEAAPVRPGIAPPVAVTPIVPVELPKAELEQLLAGAGLQWVETVARPAAEQEPAVVPPPRTPRVRRPRSTAVAEPLQQVETQPETRPGTEG